MSEQQAGGAGAPATETLSVCVVGSGTRFLSGISIYTVRLANALAGRHRVSAVLMRQLLPTFLYPGRRRVGSDLTHVTYDTRVQVFDGVDWFWIPSMLRALGFLLRRRPSVVVFQWWSGTVLHSYLLLALVAWLGGARIVIEFHEVLDTAEARLPLVQPYVAFLASLLHRMASAFTVHSSFDRDLLQSRYQLGERPVVVLPHGPHDHYQTDGAAQHVREAPEECCNLLFFGVIRPYKGLEDLVRAFDALPEDQIHKYWLTVVGETWEGWTLPAELIAASRYRDRITFVNRYVHDTEVAGFFNGADAVVLPYHRSSMSGPLQVAMGYGLPVVATHVGALTEVVSGYGGAIMVPAADSAALREGLMQVERLRGQRFDHPQSWEQTAGSYEALFAQLARGRRADRRPEVRA